jgi:hypothetical protein
MVLRTGRQKGRQKAQHFQQLMTCHRPRSMVQQSRPVPIQTERQKERQMHHQKEPLSRKVSPNQTAPERLCLQERGKRHRWS